MHNSSDLKNEFAQFSRKEIKFLGVNGENANELFQLVEFVQRIVEHEDLHGIGTPEEVEDWFLFLMQLYDDPETGGPDSEIAFIIDNWSKQTRNVLGYCYQLGLKAESDRNKRRLRDAMNELKIIRRRQSKTIWKAAQGRKLIGAASREKIRREAEKLKHFSKEKAAQNIAEIVNMSPGTVRRYLSELFPGDSWKL